MKKICLFVFLSSGLLISQAQENSIRKIMDRVDLFFKYHSLEETLLLTDREVYKPGETVWFSVLVNPLGKSALLSGNKSMNVALYDEKGKLLTERKFNISEGMAGGSLQLPENSLAGKYVLEAHSSSFQDDMKACMKLIFVDPMSEDGVLVSMLNAPGLLQAGEKNPLVFSMRQLSGEFFKSGRLKYELWEGGKLLDKGKLKTNNNGMLQVDVAVPETVFEGAPELRISGPGNFTYIRSFHVDTEKLKVKFYAEGGNFVAGTPVKVGFHVTNIAGQPVPVSAEVRAENGEIVARAGTLLPGFGFFPLIGEPGKHYFFCIVEGPGKGQQFEVPGFQKSGFSFSVTKQDSLYIYANLIFTDNDEHQVSLLATRGTNLLWASEMKISGGGRVKIPKAGLPGGLCLLSVFDRKQELIGERLIYTDRPYPEKLDIADSSGKAECDQPFSVVVDPSGFKGIAGKMVISVSASCMNTNPDNFIPDFEVNSLLDTYIPELQTIVHDGVFSGNILNYILISERLKGYSLNSAAGFDPAAPDISQKKIWLSGQVLDEDKNLVQNAKVSLINRVNAQMMNVTTNENGHFVFPGVAPEPAADYVIKAISPDGNSKLEVVPDGSIADRLSKKVKNFLTLMAFENKPEFSTDFFENNPWLFSKIRRKSFEPPPNESYKQFLKSGSSVMDAIKMIKPYQLVDNDKIVFPGGNNSLMAQDGALIVIDGQKMGTSASVISNISPSDVESIRISTNPMDIHRYTGLNSVGLIEIKTYNGKSLLEEEKARRMGGLEKSTFSKGDREMTLFWSTVDFNGKNPVSFEVFANKIKGDFLIEIRAIDKEGHLTEAEKVVEVAE